MKTSKQIRQEVAALTAEVEAIVAISSEENRELTAEETARVDEIQGHGDTDGVIASLRAQEERAVRYENRVKSLLEQRLPENRNDDNHEFPVIRVPARARKTQPMKAFKSEEDAYASGRFLMATLGRDTASQQWCQDHGLMNVMKEGNDLKGGIFVIPQFESAVIDLKEQYGVFGQYVRRVPMTSETWQGPRRISGLTAYAVAEGNEITASDTTHGEVSLVARKWAVMTKVTSELSEDAIIAIADMLAGEMAYAFAVKEDACGFDGDGTTTYHGIVGLKNALQAGSIKDAASGGTGAGSLVIGDFEGTVAKLPQYPGIRPVWFVNSAFYWNAMARLQLAAGGNTVSDLGSGPVRQFLGYPVVFAQTLPAAPGVSTIGAYFGDLSMAATMGVRRGITVAADSSRYFELDQTAIRATQRYDINVHERGDATDAGPILALKTAAS